jgi:molybdopterin-guanine dinucleotide biosynthesis protein A
VSVGIAILGGGEATRLPGKLSLAVDDLPMIARVFANVSAGRETFVAGKATFPAALDALLPAPLVIDRWSRRGPLGGLLSTFARMRSELVFAVAGDAPFVDCAFVERLITAWRAGDEALVPVHERDGKSRLEPLAALYDRRAFVREGLRVLRDGRGALRLVIERLRSRTLPLDDPRIFANVNTPEDYAALIAEAKGVNRAT